MHVLMLSIDDRIFEKGSEARSRMERYSAALEKLSIVVITRKKYSAERVSEKMDIYPAYGRGPLRLVSAFFICWKILSSADASRAIITSQDAFTHIIGISLQYIFGTPMQAQVHTDFLSLAFRKESFKNFLRYLSYCWSLKRAGCIRAVSARIKRGIAERLKIENSKISVLPVLPAVFPGDPPDQNFLRNKYPGFKTYLLMVSRLSVEKNINFAFDALSRARGDHANIILVIVGDGREAAALKERVHRLGLDRNVVFEGWQENLFEYYRAADIFLLSSDYEGYGRALIEASLCRLPIITTDVGIVGEVLVPSRDCIAVASATEMASAITLLIGDKKGRERLGLAAESAARLHLSAFDNYSELLTASFDRCFMSSIDS